MHSEYFLLFYRLPFHSLSSPLCNYMFICILSNLCIFIFLSGLLFLWSYFLNKSLLTKMSGWCSIFYLKTLLFILSHICIVSGINFELHCEIEIRVNIVTFVLNIEITQHYCWNDHSFFTRLQGYLCHKLLDYICVGQFF